MGKLRLPAPQDSTSKDPRKQRAENSVTSGSSLPPKSIPSQPETGISLEENGQASPSPLDEEMSESSEADSDDGEEGDDVIKMEVDPA